MDDGQLQLSQDGDGAADRTKVKRRLHDVWTQLAECERDLQGLREERVQGMHGESFTAEQADDLAEDLQRQIRADVNRGYQKHTPAGKGQRLLARLAPFADFLVFLYFLAVILNVAWNDPSQSPVLAVLAVVLAVLATAGVAWTLRSIASRYRQNKPDDGRFRWRQRTRQGGLQLDMLLLIATLAAVGLMMAYRVFEEARATDLPVTPSLFVALFFALIAVALNYMIFLVEFADGSTVTDELRHLRRELEPIEVKAAAARRRRRELERILDTLQGARPQGEAQPAADHVTGAYVELVKGAADGGASSGPPPGGSTRARTGSQQADASDLDGRRMRLSPLDGRPNGVSAEDPRPTPEADAGPTRNPR